MKEFVVKAPGRLCLFGEHQDYLGLPVITLAVSRHIFIHVKPTSLSKIQIQMPDINEARTIHLTDDPIPYEGARDYLASGINVLRKEGHHIKQGFDARITGTIPINAGMSSSSALVIAWLATLLQRENIRLPSQEIARLGYLTEVKEFGEAGGMMDHFSAALGNFIYLQTAPSFIPEPLPLLPSIYVVGNSLEKKTTVDNLRRVKTNALQGFNQLKEALPTFDLKTTPAPMVVQHLDSISTEVRPYVEGNIRNRDLTQQARAEFLKEHVDLEKIGMLLSEHHATLRDKIGISTPKVDRILTAALETGGMGGKINGSGFGGTSFVITQAQYAPTIIQAINDAGGEGFQVEPSTGVKIK